MRTHPLYLLLCLVLASGLAACSDRASATLIAPNQPSLSEGGAPVPVPPQPPLDETGSAICGFPIYQQYVGDLKILQLPGGSMLIVWPGLRLTLTNGNTQKTVTLAATASQEFTALPDGSTEVVARGPQGIYVLDQTPHQYLYVVGLSRFAYVMNGDEMIITQPLTVSGNKQDVCKLLS